MITVDNSVRPDVSIERTPMFLASLNWPKQYPEEVTQEITIRAGESNLVKLHFIEVNLETTNGCFDTIDIYDGRFIIVDFEQVTYQRECWT